MPESVQVGFFKVNCKEIASLLAGKYLMLSKGLIDVMAKRVKNATLKLYDELQDIKLKINEPPKDIEKLTEIKEYTTQVPLLLEKIKQEIEKSMAVYEIMEPFKYKFQPEDIQKRWLVFSGPKEIIELIDSRNMILEKEKVTFLEQMKIAQEDFKD